MKNFLVVLTYKHDKFLIFRDAIQNPVLCRHNGFNGGAQIEGII